jgi:hypothetical protein
MSKSILLEVTLKTREVVLVTVEDNSSHTPGSYRFDLPANEQGF